MLSSCNSGLHQLVSTEGTSCLNRPFQDILLYMYVTGRPHHRLSNGTADLNTEGFHTATVSNVALDLQDPVKSNNTCMDIVDCLEVVNMEGTIVVADHSILISHNFVTCRTIACILSRHQLTDTSWNGTDRPSLDRVSIITIGRCVYACQDLSSLDLLHHRHGTQINPREIVIT